jgi:hypothetical protein
MTSKDTTLPTSKDGLNNDVKDTADDSQANVGSQGEGVHAPKDGEQIVSRSADPGQSSYGGFSNEDPSKQTQEVEADAQGDTDLKKQGAPGKGSAA